MAAPRLRPSLIQLALRLARGVAALATALLLAETIVRFGLWPPLRLHPMARIANTKGEDVKAGTVALLCYPTNPRGYFDIDLRDPKTRAHYEALGMRRMDDVVNTTPFAVEQRYNSAVFRGDEIPPKRPGVKRVVVIGDSFSQGWGVREEDTFHRRLGDLLNAAAPGRWEVLNCARHDADFPKLWFLFRTVLAYDPDVVVYGMTMNDPERGKVMEGRLLETSPLIMVRRGPLVSAPATLGFFDSRLQAFVRERLEALRVEREMAEWYRDLYGDANRGGWQRTKNYIRQMKEQMDGRGGEFLLVTWPLLVGLDGRYPFEGVHETIADFCRRAEISHHDLLPALRGRPSQSLWVHPVDHHPNEVAQRLVAESLAPVLRDLGR